MSATSRFVIPAKAGNASSAQPIQNRYGRDSFLAQRVWIPACAGMTGGGVA